MSEPGVPVCTPDWLALREPADAAARSIELADLLRDHLGDGPVVVRDLGCGTGSMGRWLAPRLAGPQHWFLHDRDPSLLARATLRPLPGQVTVQTRPGDLTELRVADLVGTSLVTASALLDMLTAEEIDGLAAACVGAGCVALLMLTVSGRIVVDPPDPLDSAFAAAFDAHQRRTVGGRQQLGPDAADAVAAAFQRRGATVHTRPSPWRLAAGELQEEWLRGWIAAACVQQPDLERHAAGYLRHRLAAADLRVAVGHTDVLAIPGGAQ